MHSCALRALTLCDGHQVETPERALTRCVCELVSHAERNLSPEAQSIARAQRQVLIEEAMAPPLF